MNLSVAMPISLKLEITTNWASIIVIVFANVLPVSLFPQLINPLTNISFAKLLEDGKKCN